YPNVIAAKETKRLLDRLFPLRKCKNPPGRFCLYYHLGQCLACSENPPSKEDYKGIIHKITSFLNGGFKEIKMDLKTKMEKASDELNRSEEHTSELQSRLDLVCLLLLE